MLMVRESHVNQTKGYRIGDDFDYEAHTDNKGKLFRYMQREYGRCTSKVYVDTKEGTKTIGWVFVKKMEYDDWRPTMRGDRYYVREVWVTVWEVSDDVDNNQE
jgi:hypothetical protein